MPMPPKMIAELAAAELIPESQWDYWYLSFADEVRGFLGATVVRAANYSHALATTHRLRINPGGSVLGGVVTVTTDPPGGWLGRLVTDKAEIDRLGEEWIAQGAKEAPEASTVHVLDRGFPLCGFTTKIPRDWPAEHTWCRRSEARPLGEIFEASDGRKVIMCAGCLAKL